MSRRRHRWSAWRRREHRRDGHGPEAAGQLQALRHAIDGDEIASSQVERRQDRHQADRAAAVLLREAYFNRRPRPALERLLADTFANGDGQSVSHEAERMKLWAGASGEQRAEALVELLELGDALPKGQRAAKSRFPRIGPAAKKQKLGP